MLALTLPLLAACGDSGSPAPRSSPESTPTSEQPEPSGQPSAVEPTPDRETTTSPIADSPVVIASGLDAPWSVVFHGETPLVSERDSGRILVLDDDGSGEAAELVTVPDVRSGGEGGLLGLSVHEEHLYAYFTSGEDNRIVRYRLQGEGASVSVTGPETVLDGIPASGNHNGGRIAFGPDGMLYVTTGDASERDLSQDLDSLGGKILRLTPDGGIPADNPFEDSPVYSYGHRNPQGIAWAQDGTMYASEFGQNTWDELNVIVPGGNYGWPLVEGIAGDERFVDPVQQWEPDDASPSGITILGGSLWIANLRGQSLREVPLDDLGASTRHYAGELGRIRDAVVTPDGELWIVTNNTDGRGRPGPDDDRVLLVPLVPLG